ncbi:MAG: hypothetical protein IJC71_01975, partial [Clostridia bacterium]|nr:hypothetical protein [Clostridia bacterium]
MKKEMTKILSSLLLAAMLLPAMASCSETPASEESESSQPPPAEASHDEESEASEESEEITDNLPERNYDGFDFHIYTRESATHYAYLTEEMSGELLNDAIYERNERVTERFDVVFTETTYTDQNLPVTNVQSGDDTFSLMNVRCTAADTMGRKALAMDMSTLEYIDLSKPYWDKELAEMINVGNRTFTAIGASNMTAIDFLVVLLFNKNLAELYQVENLYDAVREGRWTLDLFGKYAALASEDLNGDGVFDAEDRWGALGSTIFLQCTMIPAANAWYIKKDADNLPYFDMGSDEHFYNVFEKIFQVLYDNNAWYHNTDDANAQPANTAMFQNGQGLFMGSQVYFVESMRDMEHDFGILPFPKYDEAQQNHFTRLCFYDTSVIPVTVPDIECSSIILEALACDSFNTVVPAYKEKIL